MFLFMLKQEAVMEQIIKVTKKMINANKMTLAKHWALLKFKFRKIQFSEEKKWQKASLSDYLYMYA